jgi:glycerophosphoryl diester phosphodiesterase
VLAAMVGLAVLGAAVTAGAGPLVAAHRGGALLWPENSLRAFREALALGVELLEADVHLTADDEVVVLHDPTLDRTTTGSGAVRAHRLADLAGVRLLEADGSRTGEALPTLARLLDLVEPSEAALLLEIKVGADGRPYPGIEAAVLALVRGRGLLGRTVIMAFEPDTLVRVRALEPAARLAALLGGRRHPVAGRPPAEVVRWAAELGAGWLGVHHRHLGPELLAAARAAGIAVGAWTVNHERDIRRVIDLGVDVVITDRPDLALRLR